MIRKIAAILQSDDHFLVVTHVNPDGDAVGSLLGLSLVLSEMGKKSRALCDDRLPTLFDFLPGRELLVTDVRGIEPPKWIISVDAADESRISGDISPVRDGARMINIDHHRTNPLFGDLNLVQPDATSSAEIVHRIIKEAGHPLSRDVGKCLYTGLITDTGCFRFSGVNSGTLKVGAEMLASGFDSYDVTLPLFEEYSLSRLQLERLVLERIEVLLDGRLIVSVLYAEDFVRLGAHRSETEDLVNRLREIRGVEVGVLVTEMPDGNTRVSLRSKNAVDVSATAKSFGGGGHARAAGLRTSLSPDEIKEEIARAVSRAL